MHADSIHFADSLKYKTLKRGRTVYGGGGIMPDYFVPLDTLKYTKYYRTLSLKNCILDSYLTYQDQHRQELRSKYKDFEQFNKNYQVPQELLDSIYSAGRRLNVKPADDAEVQKTTQQISLLLKALTARDIWDMSEYFAIINEDSDAVAKALQLIQEGKASE